MLVVGRGLIPDNPVSFCSFVFQRSLMARAASCFKSSGCHHALPGSAGSCESINALLPVAGVGGDIAGARLAHLRGVPGTQASQHGRRYHGRGGDPADFCPDGSDVAATRSTEHATLLAAWA